MKRITSIDILRALGIILMVLGHVFTFFGKFDRYIHTFHMPLFFVISGYLYHSKAEVTILKQVLQKAKRLLLPYITFGVLNYLVWLVIADDGQAWQEPLIRLITYNTSGLPICGALWFLTALFWAEVFYLILDRVLKNGYIRTSVVLAISVIMCFVQNSTEYRLPLAIDIGLVCMGFLEIGRLYKQCGLSWRCKIQESSMGRKLVLAILVFLVNGVLAFVNPYVNIKSGWYGIVPLFWVNAVLGIFAYYLFALLIDTLMEERNFLKKGLVMIGQGSIIFMGFNQLMILLGRLGLYAVWPTGNQWIVSAMVFVLVMAVLFVLYLLLSKIKNSFIKKMFGI